MKQLHPTELYAVKVPTDAERYLFSLYGNVFFTYDVAHKRHSVDLKSKNDFEILGEVTADEISFDVEPYCDVETSRGLTFYKNHITGFFNKENELDSFRSLLSANGFHFENLMRKPKADYYDYKEYYLTDKFDLHLKRWQEFENNLVKRKLIILKKL